MFGIKNIFNGLNQAVESSLPPEPASPLTLGAAASSTGALGTYTAAFFLGVSTALELLPYAPQAVGALGAAVSLYGGWRLARSLFNPVAATRNPVLAAQRETLSDIEKNFETYRAELLLKDAKYLQTDIQYRREEYDRLKGALTTHAETLETQLQGKWQILSDYAAAFDVEVAKPAQFDSLEDWNGVMTAFDHVRFTLEEEDYAQIKTLYELIITELLGEWIAAKNQASELGIIIESQFKPMEEKALEKWREQRGRVDKENRKLAARQALHGDIGNDFALIERGKALTKISRDLTNNLNAVFAETEARLKAAVVAEHPQLDDNRTAERRTAQRPKYKLEIKVQRRARAGERAKEAQS